MYLVARFTTNPYHCLAMFRLSATLLCAICLLASACHKNTAEEPEPAGSLEGTWILGLTDPVQYDAQNNVLRAFQPVADLMNFTQLTFTSSTIRQYNRACAD